MKCVPGLDLLSDAELETDGGPYGPIRVQVLVHPLEHNPLISLLVLNLLPGFRQVRWGLLSAGYGFLFRLTSMLPLPYSTETPVYISRLSLRPGGSRRQQFRLRLQIRTRILTSGSGFLPREDLEWACQHRPANTSLSLVSLTSKACVSCMTSETQFTSVPFRPVLLEQLGASKLPLSCSCHEDGGTCEECRKGLNQLVDLWSLQDE